MNAAQVLAEIKTELLTPDQQRRLAMAVFKLWVAGQGAGAPEDDWRRALEYTAPAWQEQRQAFADALGHGAGFWYLKSFRDEALRQVEVVVTKRDAGRRGAAVRWSDEPQTALELTPTDPMAADSTCHPLPPSAIEPNGKRWPVGVGMGAGAGEGPTAPAANAAGAAPSRLSLPAVDGWWTPTDADVAGWEEAYPGVDVRATIPRIRSWLEANRARRPTVRGMKARVVRWLAGDQDSGRGRRSSDSGPSYLDRAVAGGDS